MCNGKLSTVTGIEGQGGHGAVDQDDPACRAARAGPDDAPAIRTEGIRIWPATLGHHHADNVSPRPTQVVFRSLT